MAKTTTEAARALGALGGAKSGAKNLAAWRAKSTKKQRREIARNAANKRWEKERQSKGDSDYAHYPNQKN